VSDEPANTVFLPDLASLLIRLRYGDEYIGLGTSFIVNSQKGPLLITNRHNLAGRDASGKSVSTSGKIPDTVEIFHHRKGDLGKWIPRHQPLRGAGDAPLWTEHPKLGAQADVVALPLTALDDVDLFPYGFEPGPLPILVRAADPVSVIGFPFGVATAGLMGIWATGYVASQIFDDYNGLPVFLVDCRTREGQSGSPVVAFRSSGAVPSEDGNIHMITNPVWRFLGIYSGRINRDSDLGVAWKVSAIQEVVDAVK
jgi:hypothetical protein